MRRYCLKVTSPRASEGLCPAIPLEYGPIGLKGLRKSQGDRLRALEADCLDADKRSHILTKVNHMRAIRHGIDRDNREVSLEFPYSKTL